MIVALDTGLEKLTSMIESEGHKVVPLYGYRGNVDAAIYQNESMESLSLSQENYGGSGVLMICAKNLTPEQILKILKQRNYGEGSILEF